jgi:glycosyltransferase involved in cell wall biosynthesis
MQQQDPRRLNVLHVIDIGGYGGGEKLLLQLLPALNRHISTGCLIFYKKTNPKAALHIGEELKEKNITVQLEAYDHLLQRTILKRIAECVKKGGYDMVHSHLKHADLWFAVMKMTGMIKRPVVSTMHGYNDEYENKNGFVIVRKLFFSPYYRISKWIYKRLDGFILISNIVNDFFTKARLLPAVPAKVIYHGYELNEQLPVAVKDDDRSEVDIAVPGRLIKRKGHSYALAAVKKLVASHPGIRLHFYGTGPEEQSLKEKAAAEGLSDVVFFHGYVHDLLKQLTRMDIVLIPSLWEGFGLVFLDAFAAGVPVVGFDLPAGNEIVEHGKTGLLSIPYSAESLAANMEKLIQDPGLRKQMALQASQSLQEKFNMERMAEDYTSFYQQIAGTNKK